MRQTERQVVVLHLYRKALVALVAVGAIGAVGAGSAAAASWHVGGSELVGSANLAEATKITQNFVITYPSIGMQIVCVGLRAKEAKITAPNTGKVGSLVFTGCAVSGGGGCELESSEIKSKPLNVTASLAAGVVALKLVPETGTTFMTYTLTGSSCTLSGLNVVKGKATVTLAAGQEERAEQELVANTTETGELETSFGLTLKGKAKLKLGSGGAWSFH